MGILENLKQEDLQYPQSRTQRLNPWYPGSERLTGAIRQVAAIRAIVFLHWNFLVLRTL